MQEQLKQWRSNPLLLLLVSLLLSSLVVPVVKWLIVNGGPFGISRPGAISFCNVLFVGNICAALLMFVIYSPRKIISGFRTINFKTACIILLVTTIGAVSSTLFFNALATLSIVNVVLIKRLEGVFYAVVAISIFHERLKLSTIFGYVFIIVGIALQFLLVNKGLVVAGVLQMIVASALYAAKPAIYKWVLKTVPVETALFSDKIMQVIIFFVIAVYYFGIGHFADALHGSLWLAMSIYAFFGVLLSGLLWFKGIKQASTKLMSNVIMLAPILTLISSYFILGEVPKGYEWLSLAIVLIGMVIGQLKFESLQQRFAKGSPLRSLSADRSLSENA